MAGRYSNILFDLDGTITDSAEGVTRSVQFALGRFGIAVNTDQLISFIGPPLQQSFQKYYGLNEKEALQAVTYYRDYYREKGIYENRLYPSITAMLNALIASGANLFLATSKPTVFAKKILHHFLISHFFRQIVGSNLDGTRVEKDAVIAAVLENIKTLDKSVTVMVGDREHDIKGAQSCGLDSVAVTYGYGSASELSAVKPTYIVDSVPDLMVLLLS